VLPIGSGIDRTPSYIPPLMAPAVMAAALAALDPALTGPVVVSRANFAGATFAVSGPAGATVTLTVTNGATSIVRTTTIGSGGNAVVVVDLTSLGDGMLRVTVHEVDLNGNMQDADPLSIRKDTLAPNAPGIALDATSDTGASQTDWVTTVTSPGFVLTGEASATPTVYVGGVLYTGQSLAAGSYVVTATLTDTAGNVSAVATAPLQLVISTSSSLQVTLTVNNSATYSKTRALTIALTATDTSTASLLLITANGVTVYNGVYTATPPVNLTGADGTYTIAAMVTDQAGASATVTRTITLDTVGPTVTASLGAPTNGTVYDVGAALSITWNTGDATSGVISSGAKVDGTTISSTTRLIDIDSLTAGTHTITVTATDAAGNVTAINLTLVIRPTAKGILAAINDGAARGWMTAAEKTSLVSAINNVIGAGGASGQAKLRQFISAVQYPPAGQLNAVFQALLLSWANDLLTRI
jgi:hypothetical protein